MIAVLLLCYIDCWYCIISCNYTHTMHQIVKKILRCKLFLANTICVVMMNL